MASFAFLFLAFCLLIVFSPNFVIKIILILASWNEIGIVPLLSTVENVKIGFKSYLKFDIEFTSESV